MAEVEQVHLRDGGDGDMDVRGRSRHPSRVRGPVQSPSPSSAPPHDLMGYQIAPTSMHARWQRSGNRRHTNRPDLLPTCNAESAMAAESTHWLTLHRNQASAYGTEGHRFESCRARSTKALLRRAFRRSGGEREAAWRARWQPKWQHGLPCTAPGAAAAPKNCCRFSRKGAVIMREALEGDRPRQVRLP
jgi:hypothetical protein